MATFSALLMSALLLQATPSLDSTSPRERMDAVEQLSRPGRTQNIAPLAAALKREPRSDVRAAIIAGLSRIGGSEVIPVLAEALRSDLDKDVRLQVIESLERLYIPVNSSGPIRTIFNRVRSAFSEGDRALVADEKIVDPVVKTTLAESMQKDFDEDVRGAAARALGSLRARDQVPTMISFLESPQNKDYPEVRLEIVQSLGVIRDPAAGPALERAIRDKEPDIKHAAILAIGLTGHTEARQLIENLFRTDGSREVKRKSLESLSLMRDPRSEPFFESLLGHSDDYYREIAAEGLARIEHDGSVLRARYDQERNPNVRNALAYGLASADQDQFIRDLAAALDSRQSEQASVYLFELGKFEGKLGELHRYLKDSNPKVRGGILHVLGDIGDPSSRPYIEALTKDPNPDVVQEAIAALRKLTVR